MDLFTDLYFRKSQKKLYKTIRTINSAILDDHDGKKAMSIVNHSDEVIERWSHDVSKKYEEFKDILRYNYGEYYKGNRMYPKFIITKIWTYIKYHAWLFYWYLSASAV